MSKLTFISMDPSLTNTAIVYGDIILGSNIIKPKGFVLSVTKPKDGKNKESVVNYTIANRIKPTVKVIKNILESHKPDICFAETPTGSKSSSAMLSYGVSCTYISLLEPYCIKVIPYDIKKHCCKSGFASKKDMMNWARLTYPDFPWERKSNGTLHQGRMEHVADGLGAAYAGVRSKEYKEFLLNNNYV